MALMREETFGPLIGIQKVRDDDEALRLMNDTEYGLTAGVYTTATSRARGRLLAGVELGLGLLELLRPREPAPALVGAAALRGRGHAGRGRDPRVRAAEGLASAAVAIAASPDSARPPYFPALTPSFEDLSKF